MLITEQDRMMTAADSRMMTRVCAHWATGFERMLMYSLFFSHKIKHSPLFFQKLSLSLLLPKQKRLT